MDTPPREYYKGRARPIQTGYWRKEVHISEVVKKVFNEIQEKYITTITEDEQW